MPSIDASFKSELVKCIKEKSLAEAVGFELMRLCSLPSFESF